MNTFSKFQGENKGKEISKFYLIFLFAFVLGFFVDYLFYGKLLGISFLVFVLILVIFSLVLARKFSGKLTKRQIFLLFPIFLLSFGVFFRSSSFLVFFNTLGAVYLIFLFISLFSEKNFSEFNFSKYFLFPFSFFKKSFQKAAFLVGNFQKLFQSKEKMKSSTFQSAVRGIIISLPILAIFIWLFASADIVFKKYLDELFKISFDFDIILRVLIVLISSYFFVGFFAKIFDNRKFAAHSKNNNSGLFLGNIESSVILGLVGILFLIFIAIQFFYLFGGETYVWGLEENITYSEYAKKGFWELIGVFIISFLLIYGIDKFGKKENKSQKRISKILSSVVIIELFVIMASSFKRLSLYVDGYGFTFTRILGFIFLFWLFSVFLILVYKIYLEKKETFFLYSVFWLIIIFLIGMNIFNPEAFIAKENIKRYDQGKELDISYLCRLSDDAICEILKIFKMDADYGIKMKLAEELNFRMDYKYPSLLHPAYFEEMYWEEPGPIDEKIKEIKRKLTWQSFNWSRNKALTSLLENSKEIEKYQAQFLKKELQKAKKELEECNEKCAKDFFGNSQKTIECKQTKCVWMEEDYKRYKERIRIE